jgi:hypothetical protein
MRKLRKIANGPEAGVREIATIRKSNTFQPERKKRGPKATNLSAISSVKANKITWLTKVNHCPTRSCATEDVSTPRIMAFRRINAVMLFANNEELSQALRRWRQALAGTEEGVACMENHRKTQGAASIPDAGPVIDTDTR